MSSAKQKNPVLRATGTVHKLAQSGELKRQASQAKRGNSYAPIHLNAISSFPRVLNLPRLVLPTCDHPRDAGYSNKVVVTISVLIGKSQNWKLSFRAL